jgi:tetratricopeptide (TPR) repeat protein
MEVLRTDPDTDTVRALNQLAMLETLAGSPDADRLTAEALTLGQALDVGTEQLSSLLLNRGMYHATAERRPQAVAYLRESARLATQTGDSFIVGHALLNLSDALAASDPAAAAAAAQTAAGHLRRTGAWAFLVVAILNLTAALLQVGDWDGAEAELTRAVDSDGRPDDGFVACYRGWLAALRGDAETAQTMLAVLNDMRASENAQDQAMISVAEAFTAAGRQQPQDALRHARAVLARADALGISFEGPRWAWPLAVRAAHELGDTAAVVELLALLDSYQPGQLAPMLRAERDLTRARLAASDGDPAATAAFAAAITHLREQSTPYHLAHGLLDHAQYLLRHDDAEAAALAIEEARDIAARLRCQPLLDRAADLDPANPKAPMPA